MTYLTKDDLNIDEVVYAEIEPEEGAKESTPVKGKVKDIKDPAGHSFTGRWKNSIMVTLEVTETFGEGDVIVRPYNEHQVPIQNIEKDDIGGGFFRKQ